MNTQKNEKSTNNETNKPLKNNIELERFTALVDSQAKYLQGVKKHGKHILNRERDNLQRQTSYAMFQAYLNKTLSWKEYQKALDYLRDKFSFENLCGFKQLSIFDELPDSSFPKVKDNE